MPDNAIPPTERFVTAVHGKGKWAIHEVWCSACGWRTAVGHDLDAALALSVENCNARPCCAAWPEPANPVPAGAVPDGGGGGVQLKLPIF